MYTALYYPHAKISDESIIRTGLLLWDKLEYICPFRGYSEEPKSFDIGAALELISEPHLPSDEEKKLVHKEVEKLINSELPDWFVFIPEDPNLGSLVSGYKLNRFSCLEIWTAEFCNLQ